MANSFRMTNASRAAGRQVRSPLGSNTSITSRAGGPPPGLGGGVERRACATCSTTWYAPKGDPGCPLCRSSRDLADTKRQLQAATNELQLQRQMIERMRAELDELVAMKQALRVIGTDDLTFVKSAIYQWRADSGSVNLIAYMDPCRFRAIPRMRDSLTPQFHECTSVGGAALAGAYLSAQKLFSNVKAMEMLARALSHHLATPPA